MNKKQEEAARGKVSIIQDYLSIFNSEAGQRVLLDLMNEGHLLKPTSAPSDRESYLNEGKRELVLHILNSLSYNVTDLVDLIDNSKTKKTGDNRNEEEAFDFFMD